MNTDDQHQFSTSLNTAALPAVVDRATWQAELDTLRVREKAHTHEGDVIAVARRRLPMVEVDSTIPLRGPHGPVTLLEVFEGRRLLIAYRKWARKPLGFSQGRTGPLRVPVSPAWARMPGRTPCTSPTHCCFAALRGTSFPRGTASTQLGRGVVRSQSGCIVLSRARPPMHATSSGAGQALRRRTCWGALCVLRASPACMRQSVNLFPSHRRVELSNTWSGIPQRRAA